MSALVALPNKLVLGAGALLAWWDREQGKPGGRWVPVKLVVREREPAKPPWLTQLDSSDQRAETCCPFIFWRCEVWRKCLKVSHEIWIKRKSYKQNKTLRENLGFLWDLFWIVSPWVVFGIVCRSLVTTPMSSWWETAKLGRLPSYKGSSTQNSLR